jgi:hypothetical protein
LSVAEAVIFELFERETCELFAGEVIAVVGFTVSPEVAVGTGVALETGVAVGAGAAVEGTNTTSRK